MYFTRRTSKKNELVIIIENIILQIQNYIAHTSRRISEDHVLGSLEHLKNRFKASQPLIHVTNC